LNTTDDRPPCTTILVCEDDERMRLLVEMVLSEHGYRVLLAARPEEALELAASYDDPIDVVVTDVHLPSMTGPELVERLHTVRPSFEVLFLSGYPADMIPGQPPVGDAEFLQKPFDEISLLHTISLLLETHHH
jgi:two-component system cell cycle sensor histidine kinase/response regulator CckA